MPSNALNQWITARATALDQFEHAHLRIRSTTPGRHRATQQINQAYAMMLSSQFQGFCRELHDECVAVLTTIVPLTLVRDLFGKGLVYSRKLDAGNPNPGNLGSDFGRFGLAFWDAVRHDDRRNQARHGHLEDLNRWRNAIAHQDFPASLLAGGQLRLRRVQRWRQACHHLAGSFDEVMRQHLQLLLGASPW